MSLSPFSFGVFQMLSNHFIWTHDIFAPVHQKEWDYLHEFLFLNHISKLTFGNQYFYLQPPDFKRVQYITGLNLELRSLKMLKYWHRKCLKKWLVNSSLMSLSNCVKIIFWVHLPFLSAARDLSVTSLLHPRALSLSLFYTVSCSGPIPTGNSPAWPP